MPLKGLIILDETRRPIVQTNFGNVSYALQYVDGLNEHLLKSSASTPDCVFETLTSEGLSACCHLERGGLRFLVPVTKDTDPSFAFAFLQRFIDVLRDYIGEISSYSLKDNFDVVYQLLEEMLDNGYPLTTEPNTLRDIIIPPSFADRILSVAGVADLSNTSAKPFSSPIPWRKAGLKYNNNEIYFDVVEELDAIVNSKGAVISSNVCGKIMANCRLSGTPDLHLSFNNSQVISDCAFHPCVRLQKWKRDKSLSFVPPDRSFVLMQYHFVPVSATGNFQMTAPPFTLKPIILLRENGGEISFTVTARKTMTIRVEVYLGNGSTGASCTHTVGGNWRYDPSKQVLSWDLGTMTPLSTHTLKGTFTSNASRPRISSAIQTYFELDQHSYSSLKIDQLKVSGESYKPYKGVRFQSRGAVEFRWNNDDADKLQTSNRIILKFGPGTESKSTRLSLYSTGLSMNKRSNPFYPQHNAAYQRPPPPPPPAPPSQPYDYNYWAAGPQTGQPPPLPPPMQPGGPLPQWAAPPQSHHPLMSNQIPPGQTALYANYGYGGARQPYNWQRPSIPQQQPRQPFPVPQPYYPPQAQAQPHPNRVFPNTAPFPQSQPNFRPQQPMFQPPPPQHSPPHLPPAKRPRFDGPSTAGSGSQSHSVPSSSQGFGRGGTASSSSFTGPGRVPTGPSRSSSSRGRGGIGGGPSIGMMRVGTGNNQSNRGGGGGGRGGSHGSRGGQVGGGHRGNRGNWHAPGHGRRAGGGSTNASAKGRGGSFLHSGAARQNGPMNTSEKERSNGKREEPKQTLTDFKIIGLEIENMLWKWGVCNSDDSKAFSGEQIEGESKVMSASKTDITIDEPNLELSDRVEEIEFGAALKEKEEKITSSPSATSNHVSAAVVRTGKAVKSSSSTSQSPPRIRIYFNTPFVTDDVQRSNVGNGVVPNRPKRRMPADDKDEVEDDGRRIRAKLNPTFEEPMLEPPVVDGNKDRDSAPPSIDASATSTRTEDEGDWLMEAIAKDGDGSEEHMPPEQVQESEENSCDVIGEVESTTEPPALIHVEDDDTNFENNADLNFVEEIVDEEIHLDSEHVEETDPILVSQIEPPPSSVPSAVDPTEDCTQLQVEDIAHIAEDEFVLGGDLEPPDSPTSQERGHSLSQTLHSSSSSSTVVSTHAPSIQPASSLTSVDGEKKRRIPSANRISVLYASGMRRLAIDSEVVEVMKIWRGQGRIEVFLRLEREGETELKGIFPEVYSAETQSFTPSPLAVSDDLFPPWSQLIIPSKVVLTIHMDKDKPLTEPRWVKTGDLEEWLRNTFGIFWVSGKDGWEKRIEVVDPDPPPTIHTVLENWSNGSLVGLETERQRFIKTHMSESDNLLEILLRLVRGERATPLSFSNNVSSSNLHLSGPLLTALSPNSPHAAQQTHLTLAIVAMVRMAESFASRTLPTEGAKREVDEKVGEIIRCLPQHLLFKSLDGIFREWKDTRKRGGR